MYSVYGQIIRKFRIDKGLTQTKLAKMAEIDQQSISLYEADKVEIPASRLVKIALALGVPIHEITGSPAPDIKAAIEQIKGLPVEKIIEVLRAKGFSDRAIEFAKLFNETNLAEWQIEAIRAILEKSKPKEGT